MKFNVLEVNEGMQITFVFRASSNVTYINWSKNIGSKATAMGVQNNTCTTSPSSSFLDNTSEYIYTCNTTVYQVTKLQLRRSEHNDIYMCAPIPEGNGAGSNWILKVRASVLSVTLTPAEDTVDVKENAVVNITCTTSTARPAASIYWYIHPNGNSNNITRITQNITTTTDYNDFSVTTSLLRFVTTQLHNNTKILCKANNTVNTSPIYSNRKILLHVLYKAEKPYIVQGNNVSVIEKEPLTLSCCVKGGNPTPILSWNCNDFSPTNQSTIISDGNINTTLTWTVLRKHDGICTCTSQQTGFQDEKKDISLVVLYAPSKPEFEVNGSNVVDDIQFIKGKSRSIKCTADSKPSPDGYTWSGPAIENPINKDTLIFNEVKKADAGQHKCSVHNSMQPSSGGSVDGINSNSVNVVVLYPPVVEPIDSISILKGGQLNLTCNFSAGMPEYTSIEWTRKNDNKRWNTTHLHIMPLMKNDTGKYTCTASNNMIESGDNVSSYIGQNNQSFYLNVVYEASITSFTIYRLNEPSKTVNESDPVSFLCQADSNPTATITLSHGNKILDRLTSNSLEYSLDNASCLEAGIYYCSTWNSYNSDNADSATAQLFVNCRPRIQNVVNRNISSEINETIKIVLDVIAYPPPIFTWYQLVDENWTLLIDGFNYVMNSSNLQSNLTIHSVGREDFTSYRVNVENEFGKMKQFYSLLPYGKPDPPSQFRHIEDFATTSSIHLEWKPGFDNGPSQTFYVKYRKSSDSKWNYLIVADNGEQTMELTLTELTEDTKYHIVIIASNEKGNSSESKVLIVRTQAFDKPPPPGALIGGIAGGVVGCIILVIVIIVIIRRYPVFKRKGANEAGIRRSVSDDSDEDDGLVDNPMYVSSNNVASASAVPSSSGVFTTPPKPKQSSNEDLYTVVNKTKRQDKVQKGKTSTGKNTSKGVDVYENVELANKPAKNDGSKQSPPKNESNRVPKLKVVNKDGLIYADLVFNDKPPGEKMVINGDDPTPYAFVDFTKKAEPLPESDNEDEK
ncbi:Hemicentin-1 [Mactra antiquata]